MDATFIKPGRYKHFKGGEYIVIGIGRDRNTYEKVVIYQAQYDDEKYGDKPIWVRPVSDFFAKKRVGDEIVPAFEFIGDE